MFISFANFYQYFIQYFSKIAILLIFLLKRTGLFYKLNLKILRADDNEIIGDNNSRINKTVVNLYKNNKFKKLMYIPNIRAMKKFNFLIPKTKKISNYL